MAHSNPESNFHHFLARQLSTTQGRWIHPDPSGLSAVNPTDPQTWNRYTYVANNPLSFVDPAGMRMGHDGCGNPDYYDNCGGGGGGNGGSDPLDWGWGMDTGGFDSEGTYWSSIGDSSVFLSSILYAYYNPDEWVNSGQSSSTPAPNLSTVLAGTSTTSLINSILGIPSIGTPSGVQVIGLLFTYDGLNPDPDAFGNASNILVNVWQLQTFDTSGQAVTGDFQVNEQVQELNPYNLGSPTVAGPPWNGGTMLDNIGFGNPSGLIANSVQQTFTVTYPGAIPTIVPLSTVINQFSIYQNGFFVANPVIVRP